MHSHVIVTKNTNNLYYFCNMCLLKHSKYGTSYFRHHIFLTQSERRSFHIQQNENRNHRHT